MRDKTLFIWPSVLFKYLKHFHGSRICCLQMIYLQDKERQREFRVSYSSGLYEDIIQTMPTQEHAN